jgi:hypothetical protein
MRRIVIVIYQRLHRSEDVRDEELESALARV